MTDNALDWAIDPTRDDAAEVLHDITSSAESYLAEIKARALDDETTGLVREFLDGLKRTAYAFAKRIQYDESTGIEAFQEAGLTIAYVPAPKQMTASSEYLDKISVRLSRAADVVRSALTRGCAASMGKHTEECRTTTLRYRFGQLDGRNGVRWQLPACPFHATHMIAPNLSRALVVDSNGPWTDAINTPSDQD